MGQYFALDYEGDPFVLFGPAHLSALGIVALLNLLLIFRGDHIHPRYRKPLRYFLAGMLIVNEITYQSWNIITGRWSIQWNLPLHLCSLLVWLCAYLLITKSYKVYEIVYFLGIAGALQPLLTPDAGRYGFPHYYSIQFFISHGSIITAAIFMTCVEEHRPYWASIKRVFIWVNLYAVFATVVNLFIGSNYLYTLYKPHVITLLDYLGPWPWYILSVEIIALILFVLLYLPFAIRDRRNK
jgi:hypothetical integral membrane protein (TIGR02206 family)